MIQKNPKNKFTPKRSFENNSLAVITLALIMMFAPLVLAGASVILIALPIAFLSAFIGAIIGKTISSRKRKKILSEIYNRNNEKIIPIDAQETIAKKSLQNG